MCGVRRRRRVRVSWRSKRRRVVRVMDIRDVVSMDIALGKGMLGMS